ncbi:MAG: aldehyde ferredoxin oxidoreductase family protein [Chloroflexota bacterium]
MQPILKIDLSSRQIEHYRVPIAWEHDFIGGASLGARLLYSSIIATLDPCSPESPLLFLTGPLTGTAGPAVGRFVVCGKSPATGLWAESNAGGFWGPELRQAGYDGIWITGKADKPLYLWIADGVIGFRDAAGHWGKDTYESQDAIREELGQQGAHVAVIGPAAENGVVFAGIFCDHGRTAGRTGLGTVMASKNLKAIAVRGTGKIPIADPDGFRPIRSEANRMLKNENQSRVIRELGTAGVAEYADYLGSMPKKYFTQGVFDRVEDISGAAMSETILVGNSACHACVIACGRVVRLDDGEKHKGPEFETVVGLGPNLLIGDLPTITKLMELCDRYGMDTISTGGVLGLALLFFEKGILTEKDTDGLKLTWGGAQVVEELIHRIAQMKNIGAIMGRGTRYFARHFNHEAMAVQVNGLEVAYQDPRGVSGMALVYATSPRGACHNQSDYYFVDWGQADPSLGLEYFDRQAGAEKAANVAIHQNWRTVNNALVMCIFANNPPEEIAALVNYACGHKWTPKDLLLAGERAWNLKRAINIRLGLSAINDRLPQALMQPYLDGNSAGYRIEFPEMLAAYYQARDWDAATGKPTKEKLITLGLEDVAQDIW